MALPFPSRCARRARGKRDRRASLTLNFPEKQIKLNTHAAGQKIPSSCLIFTIGLTIMGLRFHQLLDRGRKFSGFLGLEKFW